MIARAEVNEAVRREAERRRLGDLVEAPSVPAWAGPLQELGFLPVGSGGVLICWVWGGTRSLYARVFGKTHIAVELDAKGLAPRAPDVIVPQWWSKELIAAALRSIVTRPAGWGRDRPGPFEGSLAESEAIVRDGLPLGPRPTRLSETLDPNETPITFGARAETPLHHASRVVAAQSANRALVGELAVAAPQVEIRRTALKNPVCPDEAKVNALSDPDTWASLLTHDRLPHSVVGPLFTRVATGSSSSQDNLTGVCCTNW